jgi:citrate synthase
MSASSTHQISVPPGLDGIIVADTSVGAVDGAAGYFHYRGHSAATLAEHHPFEAIWHLMHEGSLPDSEQLAAFSQRAGQARSLDPRTIQLIDMVAPAGVPSHPIADLRTVVGSAGRALEPWVGRDIDDVANEALGLIATMPTIVAAIWRTSQRLPTIAADPTRRLAEDYLTMLLGRDVDPIAAVVVDQYLGLTVDHGFNASTFAARCTASTGADLGGVLATGISSLSGPLHGGAPSLVLDMLDDIERTGDPRRWVEQRLASGQRIMGFGHRIYRGDDPRAALLRATASTIGGRRIEQAIEVESLVVSTLAERYPDRDLRANVEFYAAVALEQAGIARQLFTPTFAISRAVGWMAHALEQIAANRIIRPDSRYVGELAHSEDIACR